MDILDLQSNQEVSELLNNTRYKDFGFIYTLNDKNYYSCSCGYCSKINGRYGTSIFKSDEVCPKCGTKNIIEVPDVMNETIPMGFNHKVIQDDDNFLVVQLYAFGITIDEGEFCFIKEEESDVEGALVYDKKTGIFSPVEYCDDFEGKMEGTFQEGFWKDGDRYIAQMSDLEPLLGYELKSGYFNFPSPFYSGIDEIVKLFSKYISVPEIQESCKEMFTECDFESIITQLFIRSNFRYMEDAEKKRIKILIPSFYNFEKLIKEYLRYLDTGIDMQQETVEGALGVAAEVVKSCLELSDIPFLKEWEKLLRENNLIEYMGINNVQFTTREITEILSLYMKVKDSVTLEMLIKHIIRGTQNTGYTQWQIIRMDKEILEYHPDTIDFSKPFSIQQEKKYLAVSKKMLTKEQYEKVQKKPTLDTLFKLL